MLTARTQRITDDDVAWVVSACQAAGLGTVVRGG